MPGTTISITSSHGHSFEAFLALPRAGKGPGIVLCPEIYRIDSFLREGAELLAEEGYTVIVPDVFRPVVSDSRTERGSGYTFDVVTRYDMAQAIDDLHTTVHTMRMMPQVVGKIGAMGFSLGGLLALLAASRGDIACAVAYHPSQLDRYLGELSGVRVPFVIHLAGADPSNTASDAAALGSQLKSGSADRLIYTYTEMQPSFAHRDSPDYHGPSAQLAHQRSIALLRGALGPHYDFSTLWDRHCACEFESRDVDATMATMVAEPYVNHIPTMTGGVGRDQLKRFYKYHFIPKTPADTRLIPISRTIGEGILVDELLFCFTHDIEIDWMLPGVAPTGRYVEIPLVAVVKFRGDLLYNEHIYWDQASVLVQIGLLSPKGLPVVGIETSKKLTDPGRPSNTLMTAWGDSEGKPL